MRYPISTLLLLMLLVAAYFPLRSLFEPWQQARVASNYPAYALQIDCSQLREGDTVNIASRVFPNLSFVAPNSDFRMKLKELETISGIAVPENADVYRYKSHGIVGTLMFQDGKLAIPNSDDDPAVAAQKRLITPGLLFRSGILPVYALIASLLIAAWVIFHGRCKLPNGNAITLGRETCSHGN
ncbi:hypothetical protein N9L06_04390 [Mariniblastus sp.]|nr:hypothetical protein [Mariniblastus sp.]